MKDFVSRITFSFLMAQFFPGAVSAFAITYAYLTWLGKLPDSVVLGADMVLSTWQTGPVAHRLFLVGLCIAFGMLIHGFHWTVLGALEHLAHEEHCESLFDRKWDRLPVGVQILIAPVRMIGDAIAVLRRRGFERTNIRENVARIDKDWMAQHEFMQDFYLYTGQFFAHTAYALMLCVAALIYFTAAYQVTGRRVALFAVLYLLLGAFFALSRVQFATLFWAENDLIRRSDKAPLQNWPRRVRRGEPPDCEAVKS